MIVVATSIIASMTFPTRHSQSVQALHERNPVWEAPLLWKTEFLNVLSLYYKKQLIGYEDAFNALDFAERLIGPRGHIVPAKAVAETAIRSGCSSYDCEFIALAAQLGTKLITYDKKLVREFPEFALTPEAYLKP